MSNINLTCDVCGREVLGCTFVNGMKFCAKCYQEIFGETDKDRKISDLEAKLAESEEKCKKAYQEGLLQKQFDKDMEIEQLKQQLAESEKKNEYFADRVEKYNKLVEKYNNLKEEVDSNFVDGQKYNELREQKDKEIQELKQQLAEKTLTIEQINKAFIENRSLWKGKYEQSNQDKISFAVKQLEKLKEKLLEELQNVDDLLDPQEYEDYHELIGCGRGYKNSIEEIDNQINELKERCKND